MADSIPWQPTAHIPGAFATAALNHARALLNTPNAHAHSCAYRLLIFFFLLHFNEQRFNFDFLTFLEE